MSEELINIDPELWGPSLWNSMEAIVCTLSLHNKKNIGFFFENLRTILPCEKCKNHFNQYYKEFPVQNYLQNPLTLLIWLYLLKTKIKTRQERDCPKFMDWITHIAETFQVPELYYHLDKNNELLERTRKRGMKPAASLEKKYRLSEYEECLSFNL